MTMRDIADFWNRRPCNMRHSPLPVGTPAYFAQVRERRYFVEPHIPRFADFPAWGGKRVLDVGCGIGSDTAMFLSHGAFVTAIDASPSSLELARLQAEAIGCERNARFILGDAEHLAWWLEPQCFDLIWCWGVAHHTPNPQCMVDGFAQFMNAASVIRIMLYHTWSLKSALIALGLAWSEAQAGVPISRRYTRQAAARLLADYEIVDIAVGHIFPYQIADYVQYRYVKRWLWRVLPPGLFRRLERTFGEHLCITARLK